MTAYPTAFYRDPAAQLLQLEQQTCRGCCHRRVVEDILQCTHRKVADPMREDRCSEYEERDSGPGT